MERDCANARSILLKTPLGPPALSLEPPAL
jgi:hypothetical protein